MQHMRRKRQKKLISSKIRIRQGMVFDCQDYLLEKTKLFSARGQPGRPRCD